MTIHKLLNTFVTYFARKDESLLIWWYAFFILYFTFYVLDGVAWLTINSDRLASKGFNKNLHNG